MEEERKQVEEERDYHSPDFEVVEILLEQNILGGSTEDVPGFGGHDWES